MSISEPPRLSTWLLERFAPRQNRESIVGDLREQVLRGRSAWWYRRQVFGTILAGLAADIAAHKLLAVRALAIGLADLYVIYGVVGPFIQETRMALFRQWGPSLWGESEILRQLWVYYGLPFVTVTCLMFIATGWMVARLHRRLPGIVILVAVMLLIPATFQTMETRRLLATELWPGWAWGSFRWALLFHSFLAVVVHPLALLIGGLWAARSDPDAA